VAQKVTVQLVDDLDGTQSGDIGTVMFGLDGVAYEIDLTEANARNLRGELEKFVVHARRTGGRLQRGTGSTAGNGAATANREQAQAVREWARRNGFDVSDRGRISANVVEAFEAAQAVASTKTRKRKTKASAAA
jgi:Lsr2